MIRVYLLFNGTGTHSLRILGYFFLLSPPHSGSFSLRIRSYFDWTHSRRSDQLFFAHLINAFSFARMWQRRVKRFLVTIRTIQYVYLLHFIWTMRIYAAAARWMSRNQPLK